MSQQEQEEGLGGVKINDIPRTDAVKQMPVTDSDRGLGGTPIIRNEEPDHIPRPTLRGWQRVPETPFEIQSKPRELPLEGGPEHPFRLSVISEGDLFQWWVDSYLSTVTDGTNGAMIDLSAAGFDTDTIFSDNKCIVLNAVITDLVPSGWNLKAMDVGTFEEVVMTDATPDVQAEVNLLIGTIRFIDETPIVYQAVREAQRLTHGFYNGAIVRVFEFAPVHQDYVLPEEE